MVASDGDDAKQGDPGAGEVLDYVEAIALQLAVMCEDSGALRVALRLREAATLAANCRAQPLEEKAAPGDAA